MDDRQLFGAAPEGVDRLLSLGLPAEDGTEAPSGRALGDLVERAGSQIGRYQLLSVLGEGGMGIVYLAEQEEPVKRRVALKVIKPGMDTQQVVARFEAERQALALLHHPHIAQVFDAGTTEAGRPYFAMEYVEGVPITKYCDKHLLDTRARLRLFLPLCQAIQHAHQKGIIHRDIKPSNVLVTLREEKPVPKIIDFGIAKALHQRLTERTLLTEKGEWVGTPEYMSPEQAALAGLDVDTRTDLYSLGVLLYELLTGRTPFDPTELRGKGYSEMQRIICERDPIKPSTRLATLGDKAADIAKQRNTTAAQLRKAVRGDLDWIVMKALEKDRTRRYETADGLAQDLDRHLNNEPVLACPPSTLYRFRKLVRRNKGVFASMTVIAATLVIGVTVSAVSLVREQQARRQVQAQAYAADMSLAQQALAGDDFGRARRLLEAFRPGPGEPDLRGWEWRYLWQECRSDSLGELHHYPPSAQSLAYSPDATLLAVAGLVQEFVDIWDVSSRTRVKRLLPNEGHLVAFSPRGDLLAAGIKNEIRLVRTGTWEPVCSLSLDGRVIVFKFSRDGRWLAGLGFPNAVTVWDIDRRMPVLRIHRPLFNDGRDAHVGALDFSPDGKALVIGGSDDRLQVIDCATGRTELEIPQGYGEATFSVAWSPNGSIIACGSGYNGGPIRLWDAASGHLLGELKGHTSSIHELLFSANGRRLYSASGDQTIRIWDVEERQCLATLRGSNDILQGLALAPDGSKLASACKDGVVAFWSTEPHPRARQPCVVPLAGRPAFAPNGRILAVPRERASRPLDLTGGEEGEEPRQQREDVTGDPSAPQGSSAGSTRTVRLLDLTTLKEIEEIPELGEDVTGVHYSPDGTLLVSRCRQGQRAEIRVWSCPERRLLQKWDDANDLYFLRFQADGRRLVSLNTNGEAVWRDTRTWQTVRRLAMGGESLARTSGSLGRAVSPDGRLLVLGTETGVVRWLDGETGEPLPAPPTVHRHAAVDIAFTTDGLRAASVAEDGTVALWEPSSFRLINTFRGHVHGARAVTFSPEGGRLATGGGASREAVKLWDLATSRELLTFPAPGSVFLLVAFSPDGQWLAACAREGPLYLWHAPSWEEIEAEEGRPEGGQSL